MSSVRDFRLALSDLAFVGDGLQRPESVIAERDGTLWISDHRGGVTRLAPDGAQTLISKFEGESNGLAMDRAGNLYIANISGGTLHKIARDGGHAVLLSEIDGQPLGSVNFVFVDSKDRLWVTVSTRERPWFPAAAQPRPDGYIILIDERGPRIVADGLLFTNEARLDAAEEYLYVAETMGRRISRFRVQPDGGLAGREVYGPADLGHGAYVDGFAIDVEGNLWVTTVLRNGLVIITPDGDSHVVFEDVNAPALDHLVAQIGSGTLSPADLVACVGPTLQLPTSVAFAGPDRKTVYMGSLGMPHLVRFESPVAGLPLRHW